MNGSLIFLNSRFLNSGRRLCRMLIGRWIFWTLYLCKGIGWAGIPPQVQKKNCGSTIWFFCATTAPILHKSSETFSELLTNHSPPSDFISQSEAIEFRKIFWTFSKLQLEGRHLGFPYFSSDDRTHIALYLCLTQGSWISKIYIKIFLEGFLRSPYTCFYSYLKLEAIIIAAVCSRFQLKLIKKRHILCYYIKNKAYLMFISIQNERYMNHKIYSIQKSLHMSVKI